MSPIVLTLVPLKTLLLFQGKELARDGYNHEIISVTEAGSLATSKLVIKKTQEEDFGKYQVRQSAKFMKFLLKLANNRENATRCLWGVPKRFYVLQRLSQWICLVKYYMKLG